MKTSNNEMKRRLFRQELFMLKDKGYLNDDLVEAVSKAHHQYHLDLVAEEERQHEAKLVESVKEKVIKESISKAPAKIKKVKSAEEIRERNITWLLNLGVIMLLIGGLFVATSNWESMTAIMKSGSIAAVSLLFYGFTYLSTRVLNIEKTAFAFTVLGSLFLPIFVLSLGWFGLLGPYLSISGDGGYFLGVLGSFLPLVVYLYIAKQLNSRLFVWFSYIAITTGIAFLLAAFHLTIDYFYLGMVVYNALLVYGLFILKKQDRFKLFTKELVVFSQISLVISTLTMIFLYDQQITNGLNIILTAVIYLSMIFVTGRKEYHFIFTSMLVYGAYQLIEHSFLEHIGPILFALIGVGLLFIPRLVNLSELLGQIFRVTSAVISILVFLYISLEGLLLRMGEASFVLLFAYLIIGSHFVFLCYLVKSRLFNYLSSIFYAAAIYEFLALADRYILPITFSFELYTVGFLLFLLFGTANLYNKLVVIRKSSRDIGILIMIFSMIMAQGLGDWIELGLMLFLFCLVNYLLMKLEENIAYREICQWLLPIWLGLSIVSFGGEISIRSAYFFENFHWVAGFVMGAIIILITSFVWGKIGDKQLEKNSFFIAPLFYTVGMLYSLFGTVDLLWFRPIVFLGGIIIYLLFFRVTSFNIVPYFIGVTTLFFYFTIMYSIELQLGIPQALESFMYTGASVFLLLIAFFLKKKSTPLSLGYAWIGHLFYPISLLFTYFVYFEESLFSLSIAVLIYGLSLRLTKTLWQKYIFLYATLTSLAGFISSGFTRYIEAYQDYIPFIITSGFIVLIWFVMKPFYRKATMYYWIPFSIIGIFSCMTNGPFTIIQYLLTIAYILIVLYFIHIMRWILIPFVPLFLSFLATVEFTDTNEWGVRFNFLLTAGIGVILFITGRLLYHQLICYVERKWPQVDAYSFTSFLFFIYLYYYNLDVIWLHAVPGVLMAIGIYLQKDRIDKKWSLITSTVAVFYLLEPYYSVAFRLDLPLLWEREILVVPWLLLVIFIRLFWKGRFEQLTSRIQWIVLIIVAFVLIQDGMASSTIYDALILGTLSLVSMLTGMFLRIKAYFIVGFGVLFLNVFLQTRPFWGSMPWWAYLLIVGSILIFVASYNEWHKQKVAQGEETLLSNVKEKLLRKWNEWK
jgi:hypothetical protein